MATPRRSFRIPDELYEAAQAEAQRRGEDLTAAVVRFFRRYSTTTPTTPRPEAAVTVRDLIADLEDFDPEAEVLIASHDPWSLRYTVAGAVDPHDADDVDDSGHVYLLAGEHPAGSPYTPDSVFEAAAS